MMPLEYEDIWGDPEPPCVQSPPADTEPLSEIWPSKRLGPCPEVAARISWVANPNHPMSNRGTCSR